MKEFPVKFQLPRKFYSKNGAGRNGMELETCVRILADSLCIGHCDVRVKLLDSLESFEEYVTIVCTPEQFGNFIVERHKQGKCVNSIREMDPTFVRREELEKYIPLNYFQEKFELTPGKARKIIAFLGADSKILDSTVIYGKDIYRYQRR